jgi:2-amino-4-hydroxy-6-hydroxymethyldihydropteridine diphosphokinase
MHRVFLGLGGNIGNLPENFHKVKKQIEERCGKIIRSSSVYQTPPIGFESADLFWNQVVLIHYLPDPVELLEKVKAIEADFGRIYKTEGYSSRPMDIDILYYDDLILDTINLTIPHRQIQNRKFVLVPLVEIEPDFIHPLLRQTNIQLLEKCKDNSGIKKLDVDFNPENG